MSNSLDPDLGPICLQNGGEGRGWGQGVGAGGRGGGGEEEREINDYVLRQLFIIPALKIESIYFTTYWCV